MTIIKYKKNSDKLIVKINGHANYGENGKDIVCASVSVLVCTLIESLNKYGIEINYSIDDGKAEIEAYSKKHKCILNTAFDVILTGFKGIAEAYPKHVKIEKI